MNKPWLVNCRLRLPQSIFVGLFLVVYVGGVYALDVFNLKAAVSSVAISAPVIAAIWFFVVGSEFDDSKKEIQKKFRLRFFTHPCRLWFCSAGLIVVVLGLAYIVCWSETLVFVPAQDDEVAVYGLGSDNKETLAGFATKQSPFKTRCFSGQRTFVLKAPDYGDDRRTIEVRKNWFAGEEKHYLIELKAIPRFEIEDVSISPGTQTAADNNIYPEDLIAAPSQVLGFTLKCLSPAPYEISRVEVLVEKISKVTDWSFPYFGEFPRYESAGVVKGYAVLEDKPGAVTVLGTDVPIIGRKKGTAHYQVRIFGEASLHYQIRRRIKWIDVNNPEASGDELLSGDWGLDYFRDWKQLLQGNAKPRVLFNCRVDKLLPVLEKLKNSTASVLIADSRASAFLKENGIRIPDNVVVVPDGLLPELTKLVGEFPSDPPRPCSLVLLEGDRLLLQRPDEPTKGVLLQDIVRVKAISKEFENIAAKLIRK